MGADGGICWVRVRRDGHEDFNHLVGWLFWRILNETAYSYRGDFAGEIPDPPPSEEGWVWLEGAFGTDCSYDLQRFLGLIKSILDEDHEERFSWLVGAHPGEDAREYTLDEVVLALATEPASGPLEVERGWWDSLGVLYPALVESSLPGHLNGVTLKEWARQVATVVDFRSYSHEETWT